MAGDDKTEEATPHKLGEARSKGNVAQSRDFASAVLYIGLALAIYYSSKYMLREFVMLFQRAFDFHSSSFENTHSFTLIFVSFVKEIMFILAPIFSCVVFFTVVGHVGQFGFLFTTHKLVPNFDKLNPLEGYKRIFSPETLVEFAKSSIKVIFVSFILYLILKGEVNRILALGTEPVLHIFLYLFHLLAKVSMVMLIFIVILGTVDFIYQKWHYANKMKMSWQEIKDEYKQREGDMKVRARIRQIQRDRARAGMMKKVPEADVVVTNPTHVAVALQYTKGEMKAPKVIAKGAGYIALKIKEIAAEANIPIVERKQLARYIYKNVEINEVIPENLYSAVAEVLAYVYRIKNKFKALLKKQKRA